MEKYEYGVQFKTPGGEWEIFLSYRKKLFYEKISTARCVVSQKRVIENRIKSFNPNYVNTEWRVVTRPVANWVPLDQ